MSNVVLVAAIGGLVSLLGLVAYLATVVVMWRLGGETALNALATAMRAWRKGRLEK